MKKKKLKFFSLLLTFTIFFSFIFSSIKDNRAVAKELKEIKIYLVTNDDVVWGFDPTNLLRADIYNQIISFVPVINAKKAFNEEDALVTVDSMDINNLVLIVSKGTTEIRFPQNNNIAIVDGKTITLSVNNMYIGDSIYIDVEKWFLSPEAMDLFN